MVICDQLSTCGDERCNNGFDIGTFLAFEKEYH
jgi:hypothetical protein